MHREAAAEIDEELVAAELLVAAQEAWDDAVELAEQLRRAQLARRRCWRPPAPSA